MPINPLNVINSSCGVKDLSNMGREEFEGQLEHEDVQTGRHQEHQGGQHHSVRELPFLHHKETIQSRIPHQAIDVPHAVPQCNQHLDQIFHDHTLPQQKNSLGEASSQQHSTSASSINPPSPSYSPFSAGFPSAHNHPGHLSESMKDPQSERPLNHNEVSSQPKRPLGPTPLAPEVTATNQLPQYYGGHYPQPYYSGHYPPYHPPPTFHPPPPSHYPPSHPPPTSHYPPAPYYPPPTSHYPPPHPYAQPTLHPGSSQNGDYPSHSSLQESSWESDSLGRNTNSSSSVLFDSIEEKERQRFAKRSRERSLKERMMNIAGKKVEDRTAEEIETYNAFEQQRQRKNKRSRERTKERKIELNRILTIADKDRTDQEREWLTVYYKAKKRKNEGDRQRRERIKKQKEGKSTEEGKENHGFT
jgi:hypothetical protein